VGNTTYTATASIASPVLNIQQTEKGENSSLIIFIISKIKLECAIISDCL